MNLCYSPGTMLSGRDIILILKEVTAQEQYGMKARLSWTIYRQTVWFTLSTACFNQSQLSFLQAWRKWGDSSCHKIWSHNNFPAPRPTFLVPGLEKWWSGFSPWRLQLVADMIFWFLSRIYWSPGRVESQAYAQTGSCISLTWQPVNISCWTGVPGNSRLWIMTKAMSSFLFRGVNRLTFSADVLPTEVPILGEHSLYITISLKKICRLW